MSLANEIPPKTFGGVLEDTRKVRIGHFLYIHDDQELLDRFCRSWVETYKKDERFFLTVDLETTGLNDSFDEILLYAISWDGKNAVVFNPDNFENLEALKEVFRTIPINNHKVKFDARFIARKLGVVLRIAFCTMTAAKLGWAGAWKDTSLAGCVRNLLKGLTLNKQVREGFINRVRSEDGRYHFSFEEIIYAAIDAVTTHSLVYPMLKRLKNQDLYEIWEEIEKPLLQIFLSVELEGVLADKAKLLEMYKEEKKLAAHLKDRINKALESEKGFIALRNKFPKKEFNPNSRDQLIKVLALLGIRAPDAQEDTMQLIKAEANNPVIDDIVDYRKTVSDISKYCKKWLEKHIDPNTNRMHADFNVVVATGRMSCSDPPLQGIQESKREIIIAEGSNRITSIDLSQYEFRALAVLSGEKSLLDAFHERARLLPAVKNLAQNYGRVDPDHFAKEYQKKEVVLSNKQEEELLINFMRTDIHRKTGSLVTQKDPIDVTSKERSIYKTLGYAVLYGAKENQVQISLAKEGVFVGLNDCTELIEKFFVSLPMVKKYIDDCHHKVEHDNVLTNLMGRKRFFWLPPLWQKWNAEYRQKLLSAAFREAVNFGPQSLNADGLKRAMLEIHRISEQEYDGLIKIRIPIHDELVLEDPGVDPNIPFRCAKILEEKGAEVLLNKCPVEVSIATGSHLKK